MNSNNELTHNSPKSEEVAEETFIEEQDGGVVSEQTVIRLGRVSVFGPSLDGGFGLYE